MEEKSRRRWMEEVSAQMQLTVPSALIYASSIVLWLVTFMVLGRLGEMQLAGASLGMTLTNLFGNVVTLGLASAMDILLTQAHGAKQLDAMRVAVRRGMLILTISCICVSVVLYNGEYMLLAARQDPELSQIAGTLMRWASAGVWPLTMYEILKRYYQAMARLRPVVFVTIASIVVNILANYVLVGILHLGVSGVGASLTLAYWTLFLLIAAYYVITEEPDTWLHWPKEAFQKWQNFLELAIPSLTMVIFEWGSFEVALLIISYLGSAAIAEQTILMNAAYLLFVIPAGVSTAAVTRVGNSLGAGNSTRASTAACVSAFFAMGSGLFSFSLLTLFKNQWPYIYTNDSKIIDVVIMASPYLALFELTDNVQTTLGAIVKGSGRPTLGAVLTAFGFWGISVPLGSYLAIRSGSVSHMWKGYIVGELVLIATYVTTLVMTDWEHMVSVAQKLIGVNGETMPLVKDVENAADLKPSNNNLYV